MKHYAKKHVSIVAVNGKIPHKNGHVVKKGYTLAVIPARAGSKRIPHKNIKIFAGKPLIAHTIELARRCTLFNRVVVDTESPKIAAISKKYGAEVPFLRPAQLATSTAQYEESLLHIIHRLGTMEGYIPEFVVLLQTTSPLREVKDIEDCWKLMRYSQADSVVTVCPTHPRLYYMNKHQNIVLANGSESQSSNMQAWQAAYVLNGCFVYYIRTTSFLKNKKILTNHTKAVICDKWRSVDLDMPEDWVLGELLYTNKRLINSKIKRL